MVGAYHVSDVLRIGLRPLRIRNFVMIYPPPPPPRRQLALAREQAPVVQRCLTLRLLDGGSIVEAFLVDVLPAYDWSMRLEW